MIIPSLVPVAIVIVVGLLSLGLVFWLNRKRWRLWRIIQVNDPLQVEDARDWITPELVPFLMNQYWLTKNWSKKRCVIELLQDQSHPELSKLMLDFLRVPLLEGDEEIELAQAIALGFIDEKYDRFSDYYNDRDLLARDVKAALFAHGLQAEPPPHRQSAPRTRVDTSIYQNEPPNHRLMLGVEFNDLAMVQQALLDQADVNTCVTEGDHSGCTALIHAALLQHFEIAHLLIEHGADIHRTRSDVQENYIPGRGQTALWWAANHGNLPLAKELLRLGANIDTPDHYGGTPLSTAASSGELEMVRYLVEQGADKAICLITDFGDGIPDGRTPMHLAVSDGHVAVAEYLIESGCNPNQLNGNGYSPLMVAASNNYYDMAEMLLSHHADVNARHGGFGGHIGMRGYTPLVFAVNAGLVQMSKLLIQAGADVNYRVPAGKRWDGKLLPERGLLDFVAQKSKRGESMRALLISYGLK